MSWAVPLGGLTCMERLRWLDGESEGRNLPCVETLPASNPSVYAMVEIS
jgi:hypothetical protein